MNATLTGCEEFTKMKLETNNFWRLSPTIERLI